MEPTVILTAPDDAPPRDREAVRLLAEALAERLWLMRLGAKATVRLRRRQTRSGREWEGRVFLGRGGRLATLLDDEVAQVGPRQVRFAIGSAYESLLDIVYPPAPSASLEPEPQSVRLGPRQRLSPFGV